MRPLSCSVVLYDNKPETLCKTITCVLQSSLKPKLYLIDNSATDNLKSIVSHPSVEYISNNKNMGYGKAHNIALKKSVDDSLYHLVLNPDIEFEHEGLEKIFHYMQAHMDTGLVMPKVFYKNGDLQKLCNLLPLPQHLIGRRFLQNSNWTKKLNDEYELRGFSYDRCLNVPNLSGCFMFLRCSVLKQIGLFDERYFMYMEDVDLCRRIHSIAKTVFYPDISIIHGFEKESYNSPVLLKHHIMSAIKYFNKWGWFFDKERTEINKKTLQQL
jgi:GT2 family glycosyltransferase